MSRISRSRFAAVAGSAVLLAALTACGSSSSGSGAGTTTKAGGAATTSAADTCAKGSLALATPGKFTVGTDDPAYEPWFKDGKPANGQGFESAVAFAVAKKLGFEAADVQWVTVPFNNAITPGKKAFDVDINQVSISEERRKAVDFSTGYYDVAQAVITYKGSPIDGKTTVADLAGAKLGAQVGTTSYKAITDQIKPSKTPGVYDTNDLAVQALKNKQIDGIVADVPTAFYMTAAQLDNGVIVGQLPAAGGAQEQFGMVLGKGSALTPCVSKAVDALRADGTLAKLATQWLTNAGAPALK
jgi:polar amino acid transport system substrate-binding protein